MKTKRLPAEPTIAMLDAAVAIRFQEPMLGTRRQMEAAYKAMFAAAPETGDAPAAPSAPCYPQDTFISRLSELLQASGIGFRSVMVTPAERGYRIEIAQSRASGGRETVTHADALNDKALRTAVAAAFLKG